VELDEAIQRIVRHHWKLIAVCAAFGVTLGLVLSQGASTYTASARVVLDLPDPTTVSEAAAIADTARAVVTSPQLVTEALGAAGSDADPTLFARDDISVASLGSSGVLLVSVKAKDPRAAMTIADSLSSQLIRARQTSGGESDAIAQLDARLTDLETTLSRIDGRMSSLAVDAAVAGPGSSAQLLLNQLSAKRDALAQQQISAESERSSLIVAEATSPQAAIVARAELPTEPDASPLVLNMGLGLLLGLVLGVALAAGSETVRPTVVGGAAAARLLQVPLLGSIRLDRGASFDPAPIADRIRITALAEGAPIVELVPADASMDLEPIAAELRRVLNVDQEPELSLRVIESRHTGEDVAEVIVAPHTIKRAELEHAVELVSLARLPLLGVVSVRGSFRPEEPEQSPTIVREVPERVGAPKDVAS
jgi:capsular polysaccharide biosynthesis protein